MKREDAENVLPCLAGLFALEPGSHPHPSRAMTKLFDATCINRAENLEISRRRLMRSTLRTPHQDRQSHS